MRSLSLLSTQNQARQSSSPRITGSRKPKMVSPHGGLAMDIEDMSGKNNA